MNDSFRAQNLAFSTRAGIALQVWDIENLALTTRIARAAENGVAGFAIHRTLRFAACTKADEFFDDLALHTGWNACRTDESTMLLEAEGLLILARASSKCNYCSFFFRTWAESVTKVLTAHETILARVGANKIHEPAMFSINWVFSTAKGDLLGARIEEVAEGVLYDEAYPVLDEGVYGFIEHYLSADEPILVLQGPPGTGKTRLIRALLGELSRRENRQIEALYTGEMKAVENDELFVRFITGDEQVFVIEDADHLLRPRVSGNINLHRFLTLADGVVRAQGRKIVFSTNLPNIGDLDDALVRPGRCFARVLLRNLRADEAAALINKLRSDGTQGADGALCAIQASGNKTFSIAEVFGLLRKSQLPDSCREAELQVATS